VEDRRAQLLAVGAELFVVRPYDEISIDDIATAASISKGLLYHYFAGKRELYVEVVRAESRRLREVTEPDPSAPREERVRASLGAFLDYVDERATSWSALMRGGVGTDAEVAAIVEETRAAIVERTLRLTWRGRRPAPPSLRAAIRGWQGFVEAAALDWLEHADLARGELCELLAVALDGAVGAARAVDPRVPAPTAPV